jgi:hypothetical protein
VTSRQLCAAFNKRRGPRMVNHRRLNAHLSVQSEINKQTRASAQNTVSRVTPTVCKSARSIVWTTASDTLPRTTVDICAAILQEESCRSQLRATTFGRLNKARDLPAIEPCRDIIQDMQFVVIFESTVAVRLFSPPTERLSDFPNRVCCIWCVWSPRSQPHERPYLVEQS